MPLAFVQQQHIYGEVLKTQGHIYLVLKHILGNQEREPHSFPTLHLGEFWTVLAHYPPPFSFSFSFSFIDTVCDTSHCHSDSWFISIRCERDSPPEACAALWGWQVAWCSSSLHCCPAALTSFDIHTYFIPRWSCYHSAGRIQEE